MTADTDRLEKVRAALDDAHLQITYLHDRFGATGSGTTILGRIKSALALLDSLPVEVGEGSSWRVWRDEAEKAICARACAFRGEPPCWSLDGDWPNPDCDEPGCHALAAALPERAQQSPTLPADINEEMLGSLKLMAQDHQCGEHVYVESEARWVHFRDFARATITKAEALKAQAEGGR